MSSDKITEVVFVGLPGLTHQYGGLSLDNKASTFNRGSVSNPKQAALQVLEMVRLLRSLGIVAAILPPQLRPQLPLLRQHFEGEDDEIIARAAVAAPALLEKASAASAMWVANAATMTPGIDAADGKLHMTVANLFTNIHRRIEADDTCRVLKAIFKDVPDSVVHPPLSAMMGMRDEGAANHMRLSPTHSAPGLHVFIYGAQNDQDTESGRQTISASHAVARQHKLSEKAELFVRQNRDAIASGVFHNDVIAVSNENVLLVHEQAYDRGLDDIDLIRESYRKLNPGKELIVIPVGEYDLTMEEAVQSYFFNSQIVTKPDGSMAVIAPAEVVLLYESRGANIMERIRANSANPINEVHYVDLRQSMRNGGGPACLRLRVPVAQDQLAALKTTNVMADDALLEALERTIQRYYPDELNGHDLGNPELYHASREVQQTLSAVMELPLLA